MAIWENSDTFFGKAVQDYQGGDVACAPGVVHRLALDYDDDRSIVALLEEYLSKADRSAVEALVIGVWSEPYEQGPQEALDLLAAWAPELPNLRAVFVGDMTSEECEISWIIQGNYLRLLQAYPRLEVLRIRGSTSLELPAFSHDGLRQLIIECGGLPRQIVEALAESSLPSLEHLELWLGTSEYGFSGDVELYRRAINHLRTPQLRYLGLRDAEIADQLAPWLASEPWVEALQTLDLSLGTLGDQGAQALLSSPHVVRPQRLNLSHHYISAEVQTRLRAAIPGVVLDDPQEPDGDYRYVAVGE